MAILAGDFDQCCTSLFCPGSTGTGTGLGNAENCPLLVDPAGDRGIFHRGVGAILALALPAAAGKDVSTRAMFPVVCIGYFGNNIYPARAGEVLRAVVLKRREGVPDLCFTGDGDCRTRV